MKNESEKLFENILTKLGIGFSKIPESEIRTPDYKISFGALDTFWEVKEIEENEPEKYILKSIEQGENEIYSVHSDRVENSIKSAADQFKSYKVTDKPCIIVLNDQRDFAVKDCFLSRRFKVKWLVSVITCKIIVANITSAIVNLVSSQIGKST